jgi:hypothetical protein
MNVDGIEFSGAEMKLYKSKDWLYRRYVVQKKTMEEISKECGVSVMTIYRSLQEAGLIKK